MAKQENEQAQPLARPLELQIPTDVAIVTRELVRLADVVLEIARHEAANGSAGARA